MIIIDYQSIQPHKIRYPGIKIIGPKAQLGSKNYLVPFSLLKKTIRGYFNEVELRG